MREEIIKAAYGGNLLEGVELEPEKMGREGRGERAVQTEIQTSIQHDSQRLVI